MTRFLFCTSLIFLFSSLAITQDLELLNNYPKGTIFGPLIVDSTSNQSMADAKRKVKQRANSRCLSRRSKVLSWKVSRNSGHSRRNCRIVNRREICERNQNRFRYKANGRFQCL